MRCDLWKFKLRDARHGLVQNLRFQPQLRFISRVLVVASSALAEVWTRGRSALRSSNDNAIKTCACKAGSFFGNRRFHFLARKNQWNKDGLTLAVA